MELYWITEEEKDQIEAIGFNSEKKMVPCSCGGYNYTLIYRDLMSPEYEEFMNEIGPIEQERVFNYNSEMDF